MMPTYSRLLVEARRGPRLSPELERYLRSEYGPGTEAGYLLAGLERENAARQRGRRRAGRSVMHAIAEALKGLVGRRARRSAGEVSARPQPQS